MRINDRGVATRHMLAIDMWSLLYSSICNPLYALKLMLAKLIREIYLHKTSINWNRGFPCDRTPANTDTKLSAATTYVIQALTFTRLALCMCNSRRVLLRIAVLARICCASVWYSQSCLPYSHDIDKRGSYTQPQSPIERESKSYHIASVVPATTTTV